jgi:hypothetical protein
MKSWKGVDIYIHLFLTSVIDGGNLSSSRLDRISSGERAPPPLDGLSTGGLLVPTAGLDASSL